MDTAAKTGLDTLKTGSKKPGEQLGEFMGNKITDEIVKPVKNSRNVEEIIITSEKRG